MPTEELFGAYHFLLEDGAKDSFDFTAEQDHGVTAMILPAVQRIPEEVLVEATSGRRAEDDPGLSAAASHIEAYEVRWGTRIATEEQASQADGGGLRSDGDLVQGLVLADLGGDFIL